MIIVTGGAGFIGSNIVRALNKSGYTNILVVDNLKNGKKFQNLVDCQIEDYMDKDDFLNNIKSNNQLLPIEIIFHQGACSATTEWDGRYMLKNNYTYSKILLDYALIHKIPFIYASSAAVYGASQDFNLDIKNERPLNVYAYSKLLFDQHVRRILSTNPESQIIGLRYFNVYGPNEQHKAGMASVAWHLNNQLKTTGKIRLFGGSGNYAPGEQRRDFIHVYDIAAANLWLFKNKSPSGIYNLGTGKSRSFNDIANTVIAWHKYGTLEYIDFPAELHAAYQNFTEAELTSLHAIGYNLPVMDLETGIKQYLGWLNQGK